MMFWRKTNSLKVSSVLMPDLPPNPSIRKFWFPFSKELTQILHWRLIFLPKEMTKMVISLSGAIRQLPDHVISHDQRIQNSFYDPATLIDFRDGRRFRLVP